MVLIAEPSPATIGDTEPCPTCSHVKDPSKRLHEIACCGLASHQVWWGDMLMEMVYVLAHKWRDTEEYSAVSSWAPIGEEDALVWLERVHAGDVPRRPVQEGMRIECDRWEET